MSSNSSVADGRSADLLRRAAVGGRQQKRKALEAFVEHVRGPSIKSQFDSKLALDLVKNGRGVIFQQPLCNGMQQRLTQIN